MNAKNTEKVFPLKVPEDSVWLRNDDDDEMAAFCCVGHVFFSSFFFIILFFFGLPLLLTLYSSCCRHLPGAWQAASWGDTTSITSALINLPHICFTPTTFASQSLSRWAPHSTNSHLANGLSSRSFCRWISLSLMWHCNQNLSPPRLNLKPI